MKKEEIIFLNRQGFIPGPGESKDTFLKRVHLTKELFFEGENFFLKRKISFPVSFEKKVKKPEFNWIRASLLNLFDISSFYATAYFDDTSLQFFQGAATWILDVEKVPLSFLQIREKRKFIPFDMGEVLAHEMVHFSRIAFEEPKYEEFFAYLTSSSFLRKIFGPITSSVKEIYFFFSLLFLSFISSFFSSFFYLCFSLFSATFLFLGLFRLAKRKFIFNRCFRKLKKMVGEKKKALYILFRLKDDEIDLFSYKKIQEIKDYIKKRKEIEFRWEYIWACYFE